MGAQGCFRELDQYDGRLPMSPAERQTNGSGHPNTVTMSLVLGGVSGSLSPAGPASWVSVCRAAPGEGSPSDLVPRRRDYDLVEIEAVRRPHLPTMTPDIVIHLAAVSEASARTRPIPAASSTRTYDGQFSSSKSAAGAALANWSPSAPFAPIPKLRQSPSRRMISGMAIPRKPTLPYGLAKKMLLVQSQAYRQQYGFNAILLFPVNLYGPRDNFDLQSSHVIPAMIRKFGSTGDRRIRVILWGDGTPTREFLYVEDAAEGIILAAEQHNDSRPLNLEPARRSASRALRP